ncbi:MAG: hypothetical protein CMO74_12705 [Verrucomicrobiales bacterium]|nr:hypothetical protein [Verrucomicrobiales bacterium]
MTVCIYPAGFPVGQCSAAGQGDGRECFKGLAAVHGVWIAASMGRGKCFAVKDWTWRRGRVSFWEPMLEIEIRHAEDTRSLTVEKPEVVFGRKNEMREVDVDLNPDATVSRVHARAWKSKEGLQLEDLGSSLGTIVNGDRLEEPVLVGPKDVVQMGETVLSLSLKASQREKRERQVAARKAVVKRESAVEPGQFRMEFEVMSKGKRKAVEVAKPEAIIGRANEEQPVDLDLSDDLAVSRRHARVWVDDGACWVEDLKSRHGVMVNDEKIDGPAKLGKADKLRIGSTQLRVQLQVVMKKPAPTRKPARGGESTRPLPVGMEPPGNKRYPVWKVDSACYLPPATREAGNVDFQLPEEQPVGVIRVTSELDEDAPPEVNMVSKRKSVEYYRTLLQFPATIGGVHNLDSLCTLVVEEMLKIFPGAERASIYTCDDAGKSLSLKSHVPNLKPAVSPLLAQLAIAGGSCHAWQQCDKEESMQRLPIQAGMYGPLRMGKIEVGVLCVDSTQKGLEYTPEDLSLLMAIGRILGAHVRLVSA